MAMHKRFHEEEDDSRPPKRPRPDPHHAPAVVEDIHFARQLQQLIAFRQDGLQQLRNGIASFKAFLESILYHRDEDGRPRQLSILREYLDTQKPDEPNSVEKPFLGQLWQAWSFASQNNNDHVASSVSAIFALLLRTLSSLLDFRDYGLLLCRTVLQHQHLRLVKRGLDAPKHKDFVVSPCLRLLTEVASFDGGVLAREVYKRREQTFDISTLRRNLGVVKTDMTEEDARRKPSIRILTVRYVLAHLKYLHEGAKADLLKSRPLCIALFQYLADDPSDLINEVLSVVEQNVLKDSELPRSAKATLLTSHNLERVLEVATRLGDDHPSAKRAFAWLKAVCTTTSYGILRASGWYPPSTAKQDLHVQRPDSTIDLGLDSLEFFDRRERPDVRNTTLLAWIQTLRPHTDLKERDLILACFASAPELVAAYFAERNIQLEPKLSNTWIGYASFVFEVIRLAVPKYLGQVEEESFAELPPQTSILLENILPRPLTQKVLTRCLNQSSELITFFATRLLVLAFRKLSVVQADFSSSAAMSGSHQSLWTEAKERLLIRFTERAPPMKDVINAFRKIPDDEEYALQREAVCRLLRLYYELTPVQALEEQFDVSTALTAALAREDEEHENNEISQLRAQELQHLLVIAKHSIGMRWFSKQGTLTYSPIISLLRLHVSDHKNRAIRTLLYDILEQHTLLATESEMDVLIGSLLGQSGPSEDLWHFIDDSMGRASRQPVKYVDQIEMAASKFDQAKRGEKDVTYSDTLPGLMVAVVTEQVAFATENLTVTDWAQCFLDLSCHATPHTRAAAALRKQMGKILKGKGGGSGSGRNADGLLEKAQLPTLNTSVVTESGVRNHGQPSLPFTPPPTESDNRPELFRWAQKDLGAALEDGDVDALMLCLCSEHDDIRRQSHAQLRILSTRLRDSALEDKDLLSVLVGELVETFERQCLPNDSALPYLAGAFAVRALHVLQEPTHCIYPKLNRYLIKYPEWRLARMPAYWLSNTVLAQPEEDDAYWKEVQWLLDWLVDGLRAPADLEILRKAGTFEKVMALYSSPAMGRAKGARDVIMELLFKATCVKGGSGILVTRVGVLAWLDAVKGAEGEGELAGLLRRRVVDTCEGERIEGWSGVGLERL